MNREYQDNSRRSGAIPTSQYNAINGNWSGKRTVSLFGRNGEERRFKEFEPSKAFHDILIKSDLPSINTTLENVPELGLDKFNCIAMFHVLEHFYDPNHALQTCRDLLSDNGLLAIVVPNILKPYRSLDRYFLRYVHLSNFSPFTLAAMLEKHGFSTIHSAIQGDDHWYQPHSIFVIARKQQVPENSRIPSQSAERSLGDFAQLPVILALYEGAGLAATPTHSNHKNTDSSRFALYQAKPHE